MSRLKGSKDTKKRKIRNKYNTDTIRLIQQKYHTTSNKELAKECNMSVASLKKLAREFGLCKLGSNYTYYSVDDAIEQLKFQGVYGIYNTENQMIYVGSSSTTISDRLYSHICDLNIGAHFNNRLQKDWCQTKFRILVLKKCCDNDTAIEEGKLLRGLPPWQLYNTTIPHRQNHHPIIVTYEAFGTTKTIREWVRDERCVVKLSRLKRRIRQKWDIEKAISKPYIRKRHGEKLIAFGETKLFVEWLEDERCCVSRYVLCNRLRLGENPEDAMARPATTTAKLSDEDIRFIVESTLTRSELAARFGVSKTTINHYKKVVVSS